MAQFPPIIYVACKDVISAENLLRVANNADFRRSEVSSLRSLVVEIANSKLQRGKKELEKLFNLLSEIRSEK